MSAVPSKVLLVCPSHADPPVFVKQSTTAEVLEPVSKWSTLLCLMLVVARSACSVALVSRRKDSVDSRTYQQCQHCKAHSGFSIFVGVRECACEGNDLYHEMIKTAHQLCLIFTAIASTLIYTGKPTIHQSKGHYYY